MKEQKKKRWSDYLWIVELCYLSLGLFNILFAWLGMLFSVFLCSWPYSAAARLTATAIADADSYSACWEKN